MIALIKLEGSLLGRILYKHFEGDFWWANTSIEKIYKVFPYAGKDYPDEKIL